MAEVLTWQNVTFTSSALPYAYCLKFKNKFYILTSKYNATKYYVSDSGLGAWVERNLPSYDPNSYGRIYSYNSDVLVCCNVYFNNYKTYYYSFDGITWTTAQLPYGNCRGIIYLNGYFMICDGYSVTYSTDGISWVNQQTSSSGGADTPKYGKGIYVRTGSQVSAQKYSYNLTQWYSVVGSIGRTNLSFCGDFFFTGSDGFAKTNYINKSSDGINWYQQTLTRTTYWSEVSFFNGLYFLVSWDVGIAYICYSSDTITWTEVSTPLSYTSLMENHPFSSNGYFFVTSNVSTMYSKDCVTWTLLSPAMSIDVPELQNTYVTISDQKLMTMVSTGWSLTYYHLITIPKYSITPDDYFKRYQPSKSEELKNYITVTATPLKMETDKTEVGRSGATLIPTGSTVTVNVYYDDVPCDTDGEYELTNAVDSGYLSYTYCQVVSYQYYPTYASLQIRHNEISGTCNIVVAIKCRKISSSGEQTYNTSNDTSIAKFGKRVYDLPRNHLVQSLANAQTIAVNLLNSYSNFRKDQRLEWRGDPSLILGDTVELTEYKKQNQDIKGEYYQIKNQLSYDGTLRSTTEYRKKV